jgi:drug/metabolite transporter (DMT)-like permease
MNFVSGSVYSIMNGLVIIASSFFSRFMLHTQLTKYQIIGCIVTIIGITLAGIG